MKKPKGGKNLLSKSLIFSFSLIGQIGFSTAIPLVTLGLIGRYLDKKFGSDPYLLLTGLAIATVLIYFILRKIVSKALKSFNS